MNEITKRVNLGVKTDQRLSHIRDWILSVSTKEPLRSFNGNTQIVFLEMALKHIVRFLAKLFEEVFVSI